jgi:hypothetical protein
MIVRGLSDEKLADAPDLVRTIRDEDDEPPTEEELTQIADSVADIAAGRL